jgi:hypothetical protein
LAATFRNVENCIGSSAGDRFVFADPAARVLGVLDGRGGQDSLEYTGYTAAQPVSVNLRKHEATNTGGIANVESFVGSTAPDNLLTGPNAESVWRIDGSDSGALLSAAVTFSRFAGIVAGTGPDKLVFAATGSLSGSLDGGPGENTLDFSGVAAGRNWSILGADAGAVTGIAGGFRSFGILLAGPGDDRFDLAAAGRVSGQIAAGLGNDALDYAAAGDVVWRLIARSAGYVEGAFRFTGVENLTSSAGDDWFQVSDGAGIDGILDGGLGDDAVDYAAWKTGNPVTVNTKTHAAPGMGEYRSVELFVGGKGTDSLIGPDADQRWDITGANTGEVQGQLRFIGFENLVGGEGSDRFVFAARAVLTGSISGGGGDDVIDYSAGDTSIRWEFRSASGGLVRTLAGAFALVGIESLIGGAANDEFVFLYYDPAAPVALTLDGRGGADSLDFSAIAGPLAWHITGIGAGDVNGTVEFTGIESLVGGAAVDTLDLAGLAGPHRWDVTQAGGGLVDGALAFRSVENLSAGPGDDTFAFHAGGSLVGLLDGGGGDNTLDYSALGRPVEVNLQGLTGTALGTFLSIRHVIGGAAFEDALTGADRNTVWAIGATGRGWVNAELEFVSFEQFTGGAGDDSFVLADGARADSVSGGLGRDALDLSAWQAPTQWSVTADNAGEVTSGSRQIVFSNVEDIHGGAAADRFILGNHNLVEAIYGHGGVDYLDMSVFTDLLIWSKPSGTGQVEAMGQGVMQFNAIEDVKSSVARIILDNFIDLTATVALDPMWASIVPGETGAVDVAVTNQGNTRAAGKFAITLYLSHDKTLDAADKVLARMTNLTLNLAAGQVGHYIARPVVPADAGVNTYYVLADVDSGNANLESNEQNNVGVSGSIVHLVWEFGNLSSGRTKPSLTVLDVNGTPVTFTCTDGKGTILGDGTFAEVAVLPGLKKSVAITIKYPAKAQAPTIRNLTMLGAFPSLDAAGVNFTGTIRALGAVGSIMIGNLSGGSIVVEAGPGITLKLGALSDAGIRSTVALGPVTMTEWRNTDGVADFLSAPAVSSLATTKGGFQADLRLSGVHTGMALGRARIAGDLGGAHWDIVGKAGPITVVGAMRNSTLRATTSLGALVLGAMLDSDILVGVSPTAGRHAAGLSAFVSMDSTISSLRITGTSRAPTAEPFFANSNVSAGKIGSVSIANAKTVNGTEFGLYAAVHKAGMLGPVELRSMVPRIPVRLLWWTASSRNLEHQVDDLVFRVWGS